jgi:hypothetical protein
MTVERFRTALSMWDSHGKSTAMDEFVKRVDRNRPEWSFYTWAG